MDSNLQPSCLLPSLSLILFNGVSLVIVLPKQLAYLLFFIRVYYILETVCQVRVISHVSSD